MTIGDPRSEGAASMLAIAKSLNQNLRVRKGCIHLRLCSMYLYDWVVAAMLAVRESWTLSVTPSSSGGDYHRVVDLGGRALPWKEKQLSLVCGHSMRDVSQTGRDTCWYLCFRLGKRELIRCHLHSCCRKKSHVSEKVGVQREEEGAQD